MAKEKIFHIQRESDGTEHLVRTSKESAAIAAIVGNQWKAKVASPDDIYSHFNAGRKLHPASVDEEKGMRFIIVEPAQEGVGEPALVRAKNPGAAIGLITDGDIQCKVADDETLVRLLAAGKQVIDLQAAEETTAGGAHDAGEATGESSQPVAPSSADEVEPLAEVA